MKRAYRDEQGVLQDADLCPWCAQAQYQRTQEDQWVGGPGKVMSRADLRACSGIQARPCPYFYRVCPYADITQGTLRRNLE